MGFKDKWDELGLKNGATGANPKFNKYVKFHFSDHRSLWMELDTES